MKVSVTILSTSVIFILWSFIVNDQQNSIKKNAVYLELGGNNYYYSINYERYLFFNISPRVGASIVPAGESSNTFGTYLTVNFNLLFMINYSVHLSENHIAELGYGYADILNHERIYSTISVGYKFIPNNSRMILKASFTPIFNKDVVKNQMWFGLGVGFNY